MKIISKNVIVKVNIMVMYKKSCPDCSGKPENIFEQLPSLEKKVICKKCNGDGYLYFIDGSLVDKETYREINIFEMSKKDNAISNNEKRCYKCGIGLDPDFEKLYDGCCYECYDPGT